MPELIRDVDVLPPNLKSTVNSNLPFLVLKNNRNGDVETKPNVPAFHLNCVTPRETKTNNNEPKKKKEQQIQNVRDPIRLVLMLFTSSPLFSDMCENKGRLRRLSFLFASQCAIITQGNKLFTKSFNPFGSVPAVFKIRTQTQRRITEFEVCFTKSLFSFLIKIFNKL